MEKVKKDDHSDTHSYDSSDFESLMNHSHDHGDELKKLMDAAHQKKLDED